DVHPCRSCSAARQPVPPCRRADKLESREHAPIYGDQLYEYGLGAYPQPIVAVECAVDDKLLLGFRMFRTAEHLVLLPLVMTISAWSDHGGASDWGDRGEYTKSASCLQE